MTSAELESTMGTEVVGPDLFGRIRGFGADSERLGQLVALVGALGLHAIFGGMAMRSDPSIGDFASDVQATTLQRLRTDLEIEVAEPPVVEEKPEPEPQPVEEQPTDAKVAETTETPTEAPAAAAAQAGALLTQTPDPNEPLDLTGEGFVTGNDFYRGGTTMANGTATTAVRAKVVAAIGTPGGTGTGPGPAVVSTKDSKARPAGRVPGSEALWKRCPFPGVADLENINSATVTLVITVGADGSAKNVSVASESSAGFGKAATRCAYEGGAKLFEPALDDAGKPLASSVLTLPVRFTR